MRKIGKNGRTLSIMMYEDDANALDDYLVKSGVLTETLCRQTKTDHRLRPTLVKARKDAIHKIFQELFEKSRLQNSDVKTEQPTNEDASHAFYVLERVTPEILGSGSSSQEIAQTNSLDEALEIYRSHRANHLTRYCRVNGRLTSKVWDEDESKFV